MAFDRSSLHASHFPYLQFDNSKEMWLLNGLRISRELSSKLVQFFLPLFLFQIGSEKLPFTNLFGVSHTPFQQGLLWLASFFLVRNIVVIFTAIPLGKLVTKIGLQKGIILSQFCWLVYFWLLYLSKDNYILTLFAAILDGLQTLFWISYFTVLSQNAEKIHMGSDLGVINFWLYLTTLLAPVLGGWLIVWQGFSILFLVGICCVLLGAIFGLLMIPSKITDQISWQEFLSWLKEKTYQKLTISYLGRYLNDSALSIWPLYVFFMVGSEDKVGYLYALALFLAMVLTYIFGLVIDKTKSRRPFILTGGILSIFWLVRVWVESVWAIVAVDACDRLVASFHWLYFDKQFLSRSKGREALSFFTYREIIIGFSAILFWCLFGVIFGFWSISLKSLFIVAALGVWLSLFVRDQKSL